MTSTLPTKINRTILNDSDSDDGKPLMQRLAPSAFASRSAEGRNGIASSDVGSRTPVAPASEDESSSDDDVPLIKRMPPKSSGNGVAGALLEDAVELVAAPKRPKEKKQINLKENSSSDSEDDKPLAMRRPSLPASKGE